MERKPILITGASGFIGRNLCRSFAEQGIAFRAVVRNLRKAAYGSSAVAINIDGRTDWIEVLEGVEVIVHLAARVHVMQEHAQDPLVAFRAVNVDGTLNLARQAAAVGVKRFVFLSTIKVNGEETGDVPFHSSDIPAPVDPYGISKLEAERGLQKIAHATGLEVVIIRPPLVYGPGAGGNYGRLRRLAAKGWPLPLAAVHNKRSFIGVDNLCDCIRVCLHHPDAAGKTLLVSDNHDISTPDLVRLLASSAGRSIRLLPVPVGVLQMLAKLCGREPEVKRLTENLQVDCSETMRLLNWQPPVSLEQGIKRSVV